MHAGPTVLQFVSAPFDSPLPTTSGSDYDVPTQLTDRPAATIIAPATVVLSPELQWDLLARSEGGGMRKSSAISPSCSMLRAQARSARACLRTMMAQCCSITLFLGEAKEGAQSE